MHRFTYVLTILLVLMTCSLSFAVILPNQALLVLRSSNYADTEATIASIEYCGAHAQHVLSNKFVVADVPPSAETGVRSLYNVYKFFRTSQSTSSYSGDDLVCIGAWNFLFSADVLGSEHQGTLLDDAIQTPYHPLNAAAKSNLQSVSTHTPGYYDTSEYMMGKISVGLVVPESDGGTENWTPTRLNTVFNQVVKGLNWWIGKCPATVKAVRPTFYYDRHMGVPCQYEPISCNNEWDWITDAMLHMGYTDSGGPYQLSYKYINDLKAAQHTDFGYVIYVADSANDADGYFAYGQHAYAMIDGPYCVLNWRNDGWGIDNFYKVLAHETGHVFGCGDEYGSCSFGTFGYLHIPNSNCEYNNTNTVDCIMRNSSLSTPCQYTIGQVGWRDSDSDGIPDPVDNPVTLVVTSQLPPDENGGVTITGTADNIPYSFYNDGSGVTISKISSVKYRIDGGSWIAAMPSDGKWDQQTEDYTFTTAALEPGSQHLIDIKAFSTSSNVSDIVTRIVDRTPPVMGQVTDEGDFGYDETRLSASWSATDPDSEVTEYTYAIGTTPTDPGSNYVKDWTSTGINTSVSATSLNLSDKSTYYFYVKAKNSSGYWSNVAVSNGITIRFVSIAQAKKLPADTWIALHDKVVTGNNGSAHYLQEPDNYFGIKVIRNIAYNVGQLATVRGFLKNIDGEFQIGPDNIYYTAAPGEVTNLIKPLYLTNKAIGGGTLGSQNALWEWRWVKKEAAYKWLPAYGLNNVGTLVKTSGKVIYTSPIGACAYIDDGSNLNDGNTLGTNGTSINGLRINLPNGVEFPPVGTDVTVVGVSSTYKQSQDIVRAVLVRSQQDIAIAGKAMITGVIKSSGICSINQLVETAHPYPDGSYSQNCPVTAPASALQVRAHFSKIEYSNGYLAYFLYYGRYPTQITLTNPSEDYWTNWITGSSVNFAFVTSGNPDGKYGFTMDRYEYRVSPFPMAGITVRLSPGNRTAVTDSQGRYVFDNLEPGTYTVTPVTDGGAITPENASVTIGFESQFVKGIDFTKN